MTDSVVQVLLVLATTALALFTAFMWWSTRSVARGTAALGEQTAVLSQQTALLAAETATLARETTKVAVETLAATMLADQHHQEAMMPLVVLEHAIVQSPKGALVLTGMLRNIGPGIALKVRVWIGELGEQIHVGPLGAGASAPINLTVFIGGGVRQEQPIKIVLLYENLFGAEAKTEHHGRCHVEGSFNTVVYPPSLVLRVTPDVK